MASGIIPATNTNVPPHMKRSVLFGAIFSANIFLIVPIILANRLYIDDLGRSIHGYFGWSADGRPLATILYYLVNLGAPAINVFPLNQILAALVISGAALLLIELFNQRNFLISVLATLPLGAQAYYLENLSYAYDSLTMSAAVFFSVAGAYFIIESSRATRITLGMICILFAIATYQAAIIIFFITLIYFHLRQVAVSGWADPANLKLLVRGIFAATTAFMFYFMILKVFPLTSVHAAVGAEMWSIREMPMGILKNVASYWRILWHDWHGTWPGIFTIMVSVLGIFSVSWPKHTNSLERMEYVKRGALVASCLVLVVALSFGILLLLKNPVWAPRSFLAIGIILSLFSLEWINRIQHRPITSRRFKSIYYGLHLSLYLPVIFMSLSLVVVAYAYGRASLAQKEFESSLLTRLVSDIEELATEFEIQQVAFMGCLPASPLLRNSSEKFPVIGKLVPIHISGDWWWGHVQLMHMGTLLAYSTVPQQFADAVNRTEPPIRVNQSYRL